MSHYRKLAHRPDYRRYIETRILPDYKINVYMVVHLLAQDTTSCTTMALYTPPNAAKPRAPLTDAQEEGKKPNVVTQLSRSFSTESIISVEALAD